MINTTSEHVKILKVEKSCTCTSFKLGKYELAPGEGTTLAIDVAVTETYMKKFATCVLKTDHPQFKDWAYNVQFISLPFVVAEPSDLNLGSFAVDGKNLDVRRVAYLDFFAKSKIALSSEDIKIPEELELSIVSGPEARRLQPGVWNTRYRISIGLSPKGRETILRNDQSGLVTKLVHINAGKARVKPYQYSVFWTALAPLECRPSYLTFGNLLDEKGGHSARMAISSTTNEKFRILSVKSDDQDLRIQSSIDSLDEAERHCVTIKPLARGGPSGVSTDGVSRFLSGTIEIQTTDKRRPVLEIPWSASRDPLGEPRSQVPRPKSSS